MNKLTTTNNNNHFTVETSIMEQILDASGYNFHVLTIDGHKYWIGKELAHAFGYSNPTNMFKTMKEDVHKKIIVKNQPKGANKNWHKNRMEGLYDLAPLLEDSATLKKEGAESYWGTINFDKLNTLILVREDTLQEYLTLYTRKPDAKDVGKKLYEYLSSPKTLVEVFSEVFEEKEEEELEDYETTLLELAKDYPALLDSSKKINSFFFGLVGDKDYAVKLIMGYQANLMGRLIPNVKSVIIQARQQGLSKTLTASRRNFLRYLSNASGQIVSLIDTQFILKVTERIKLANESKS